MTANRILGILGTILGIVAIVLVAVNWSPSAPSPVAKTQTIDVRMGEGEIIQEVGGVEELTGEFHRWEPDVIVVHKGDHVVLNVTNPRSHPHSLVLTAFGVDTGELAARTGSATVEFDANQAGTFQFACGIAFDEAAGKCDPDHARMVGYLTVLE